jgi:hypothetical protein
MTADGTRGSLMMPPHVMPGLSRSEVSSVSSDLVHATQRMGPPACGNSCGAASGRSALNMRSSFSWPAGQHVQAACCGLAS